mmetsp:Transcript_90228/g.125373  ORF Transcript_90228/g.125373 Transcript_90228/m.125373 type:complete len:128 (+) Transcript_90228:95-478(+)
MSCESPESLALSRALFPGRSSVTGAALLRSFLFSVPFCAATGPDVQAEAEDSADRIETPCVDFDTLSWDAFPVDASANSCAADCFFLGMPFASFAVADEDSGAAVETFALLSCLASGAAASCRASSG